MSPARPTAHQIAIALVFSAHHTGDDPQAALKGAKDCFRTNLLAFAALCEAYPRCSRGWLGNYLHIPGLAPSLVLADAKKSDWWHDEWVEEVVGAVVAERYGEQAL